MCHLVLLMPVIALPIFWLMPLNFAVPIYVFIALASGLLYWLITRSIMKPVATGAESLIGTGAEVVSRLSPGNPTRYLVRAGGELWTACCPSVLQPGETVNITDVNGICLVVECGNKSSHPVQPPGMEAKSSGARTHEWNCH